MFGVGPGLRMVESIWRMEEENKWKDLTDNYKLSFPSCSFSSPFLMVSDKTFLRPNFHALGLRKSLAKEGTSQRHQVLTLSNKSLFLFVKAGHIALKWGEMLSAVTIVSQGECFGRKPVFNHIATSHHYRASLSATT